MHTVANEYDPYVITIGLILRCCSVLLHCLCETQNCQHQREYAIAIVHGELTTSKRLSSIKNFRRSRNKPSIMRIQSPPSPNRAAMWSHCLCFRVYNNYARIPIHKYPNCNTKDVIRILLSGVGAVHWLQRIFVGKLLKKRQSTSDFCDYRSTLLPPQTIPHLCFPTLYQVLESCVYVVCKSILFCTGLAGQVSQKGKLSSLPVGLLTCPRTTPRISSIIT